MLEQLLENRVKWMRSLQRSFRLVKWYHLFGDLSEPLEALNQDAHRALLLLAGRLRRLSRELRVGKNLSVSVKTILDFNCVRSAHLFEVSESFIWILEQIDCSHDTNRDILDSEYDLVDYS